MRHAASWFKGRLAAAQSARPHVQHHPVLVFNCPIEKDTLGLLLPLSTVPFRATIVSSVGTLKPTLAVQPGVEEILGGFLARKRCLGDTVAVGDLERALAATAPAGAGMGDGSGGSAGAGGAVEQAAGACGGREEGVNISTWREALLELWGAVHSDARLQLFRQRVAQPVEEYQCGEEGAQEQQQQQQQQQASAVQLPGTPPPSTILTSTDEVFAALRAHEKALGEGAEMHVFATGSLYLVGEFLDRLGDGKGDKGGQGLVPPP